MHIAIDLQACQGAGTTPTHGCYLLRVVQALLACAAGKHEVSLIFSSAFSPAIQPVLAELGDVAAAAAVRVFDAPWPVAARQRGNDWRRAAARLARESFLAAQRPDAVVVLSLSMGYEDDAVVSVGELHALPTVALLPGVPPAAVAPQAYVQWREHVLAMGARADHLFTFGRAETAPDSTVAAEPLPDDPSAAAQRLLQTLETLQTRMPAALAPVAGNRSVRPRLAYVSPLPPAASGIADYSAELLPALAEHYEIDLILAQPEAPQRVPADMPVRTTQWLQAHASEYDRILYHFGNSPFHAHMVGLLRRHPGTVVLHDFYLGHLFGFVQHSGIMPLALKRAMFRSHGYAALQRYRTEGEAAALQAFPCNLELFAQATGIIVHSNHALELAQRWYGPVLPCEVSVVPLARAPAPETDRVAARRRLGVDDDTFLVCSFGYAGEGKLSLELVEAWLASPLAKQPQCRLVFVGGHQMENEYSRKLSSRIAEATQSAGVTIAGYVPFARYRDYLAAADLAVQLRANSRGESSAALLDAMAHNVALITNAHGAAAELPDTVVHKLAEHCTPQEIAAALVHLHACPGTRQALAARAAGYFDSTHRTDAVASMYRDAIELAAERTPMSATGRARRVVAALAADMASGRPEARDVRRLASSLLKNHQQPQPRAVPVDMAALRPKTRRKMANHSDLRGLLLVPYPARDALRSSEIRAQRMQFIYEDAGVMLDVVRCHLEEETWCGPPHWTDMRLAAGQAEGVGQGRHAAGLALLKRAQASPVAGALTQRLSEVRYDFIQLEQPFLWPMLRRALQAAACRPRCLIYSSHRMESDALADSDLVHVETELARAADLILTVNAADRLRFEVLGSRTRGVHILPNGAAIPDTDRQISDAIYRDHLPKTPFALIVSDDVDDVREGFFMLLSPLAFLPPDTRLVVAGKLSVHLSQSPRFAGWSGINFARAQLMGEVDEQTLASLRRHAHVVVLPRVAHRGASGPDIKAAEALSDGGLVLATSAALQGYEEHAARTNVFVEDEPARFRSRLLDLLAMPARRGVQASIAPWHVTLGALPALVRRAVADFQEAP